MSEKSAYSKRRRTLLKTIGSASALGIAGCSGDNGTEESEDTDQSGDTDTQTGPQELLVADKEGPNNLDPHALNPTRTGHLLAFPENAYETLVYFEPDNIQLAPALATEVPSTENGLVAEDNQRLEFPLREGVTFHTGGEMTAEDVVFSIDRVQTLNQSPFASNFDVIESVEATDDYTVVIRLSEPFAPFLTATLTQTIGSVVSKQAVEENGGVQEGQQNSWMSENTAGTGPFQKGEWVRGDHIIWQKFDDYWDSANYPNVDRVRQMNVPELGTRLAMLRRNEAHVIESSTPQLEEIQSIDNAKTEFRTTYEGSHIEFNMDIPYVGGNMPDSDTVSSDFFRDPNVRKAIGYAFDYETYIESTFNGHFARSNTYHMPGTLGFDPEAPNFTHQPDKAEEHLKEAGYWEEGFTVSAYFEGIPQFEDGALMIQDSLERLNDRINVEPRGMTEAQYAERTSGESGQYPMMFHGFLPEGPDPHPYIRTLCHPDGTRGSRNNVDLIYDDSTITDLIEEGGRTVNESRRQEIYAELQRRCFENPAVIGIGVVEGLETSAECVTTQLNPAWRDWHFKYYDIESC